MIAEVALKSNASIAPHSNPNLTYFLVIEGGGFVRVGDEQARVAAGEAVVWPPDVVHSAWTEHTPMRAIVVEFATDAADVEPLLIAEPRAAPEPAAADSSLEPGPGSGLVSGVVTPRTPAAPAGHVSPDEEPW